MGSEARRRLDLAQPKSVDDVRKAGGALVAFSPEVAHTNWDQGRMLTGHALALIDSLRNGLVGSDINGEVSHYHYQSWWKRRLSAMDEQPEIDPAQLAGWQAQQHALNLQLLAAIAARSG